MKSKTFCFNRTVFKKNMTHFWPIWALYTCYLLLTMPVTLWLTMQDYALYDEYTQAQRQIMAIGQTLRSAMSPFVVFIVAAISIMAVFSYLYSAKNAYMIHSLPVSRLELFVTNFSSAFVFMLIPQLLTFIVTVFVCIGMNITNIEYILLWFGSVVGITFFALALGVFVAMFTGQVLAFPFYYFIINYLYVGCMYIISMVISTVCFGVSDAWNPGKTCILSPIYYLNNNLRIIEHRDSDYNLTSIEFSGGHLVFIYAAAAVVFLVLAYLLYKKRRLETAGDLITIKGIKPIFRWGTGICIGTTFGVLLTDSLKYRIAENADTFWLLLASVLVIETVGFFLAEMMIEKTFRIFNKKRIAEWFVFAAGSVLFLGMFKADVLGIEKYVPKAEEVAGSSVRLDYKIRFWEEDVQKVIDLHKDILKNKEEFSAQSDQGDYAEIAYRMKDGTEIKRYYPVPVTEQYLADETSVASRIIGMESETENMMQNVFGRNYKTNEYYAGNIQFFKQDGFFDEYRFSDEELETVIDAVMADIKEGNMDTYQLYSLNDGRYARQNSDLYYNTISVDFYNPDGVIWNDSDYYSNDMQAEENDVSFYYVTSSSAYIEFGAKCTNTVSALKKLGILNEENRLVTYDEYERLTEAASDTIMY